MKETKAQLFAQAFAYRQAKPWNLIWEDSLFALRMPSGRRTYFMVLGQNGDYCALMLFHSEQADNQVLLLDQLNYHNDEMTMGEYTDKRCSVECIHCELTIKDGLQPQEEKEARAYAKAHGFQFRGKNSFPHFVCYSPHRFPSVVTRKEDMEALTFALEAALFLHQQVQDGTLSQEQKQILAKPRGERLLELSKSEGGWRICLADYPQPQPENHRAYVAQNEIALKRLKGVPRKGNLQCQLLRLDVPVVDEHIGDERPLFPVQLFAVEPNQGYVLPVETDSAVDDDFQQVLENFITALLDNKLCPKNVWVKDARTRLLLQDTCDKLHIPVKEKESLPQLEEFEEDFIFHLHEAEANGELDEDSLFDSEDAWDEDWDEAAELENVWEGLIRMNDELLAMPQEDMKGMVTDAAPRLIKMLSDSDVPYRVKDSIRQLLAKAGVSVPAASGIRLVKKPGENG